MRVRETLELPHDWCVWDLRQEPCADRTWKWYIVVCPKRFWTRGVTCQTYHSISLGPFDTLQDAIVKASFEIRLLSAAAPASGTDHVRAR